MLSRAILSRYHLNSTCPQDRSSFMPITRQAVHRYFRPISAVSRRQLGALPLCILPYGILTAVRSLKRQSDKPLRLQRFYNTIVPPLTAFGKRISAKRLPQNVLCSAPDIPQPPHGHNANEHRTNRRRAISTLLSNAGSAKGRISKRQVDFRERLFGILYMFFSNNRANCNQIHLVKKCAIGRYRPCCQTYNQRTRQYLCKPVCGPARRKESVLGCLRNIFRKNSVVCNIQQTEE